ncbi:MAG: CpaF family protein [Anaerolineales bacterium]|nr:MAG: CpaF family protein [Anaerolineales bacterium]
MSEERVGRSGESDKVGRMLREAEGKDAAGAAVEPFAAVMDLVRDKVGDLLSKPDVEEPVQREAVGKVAREVITSFNAKARGKGAPELEGKLDDLVDSVIDEILGLGVLETLLSDDAIEDIYIIGTDTVQVVTADGERRTADIEFQDRGRLMVLVRRALAQDDKSVNYAQPFADGRLRDGSRIHVSIHPCADPWPQVVIRRHRKLFEPGEDRLARLIEMGTLTPQAALLLRLAVQAGASVLMTGATAAGKTTAINALAGELDAATAVVCIEDTRELNFPGANVSYLTTRLPSVEGEGAITQGYLVQQALRKRPDWIVLGEARGAEAWHFAQAGNTGHSILGSVHANSTRDAIERYRDLCLEAGENLRENVVLRGVVRAFRLVVYLELDWQLRRRTVKSIADVTGGVSEEQIAVMQELFEWKGGQLVCTPKRPYPRLQELLDRVGGYDQVLKGENIPPEWAKAAEQAGK